MTAVLILLGIYRCVNDPLHLRAILQFSEVLLCCLLRHGRVTSSYGYQLIELPLSDVESRADFVIRTLAVSC